jgi:hypothetical protein
MQRARKRIVTIFRFLESYPRRVTKELKRWTFRPKAYGKEGRRSFTLLLGTQQGEVWGPKTQITELLFKVIGLIDDGARWKCHG